MLIFATIAACAAFAIPVTGVTIVLHWIGHNDTVEVCDLSKIMQVSQEDIQ